MTPSRKRLIDIHQLCDKYSFSPWTVRTWCSQRKIPHCKIGSRVLFDVAEIESWLKGQAIPAVGVIKR